MDNSCKVPEVKPITIKRFGTAGLVPTVPTTLDCNLWQKTDLKDGEFAINTVDNRLYIRSGNQIIELTNQSSGGGGGGSQTLAQTLTFGNTSGSNDIEFDATQGLLFANNSRLREGTIDAGLGGNKGIAQICGVGYELKWEAGRLYVMNGDGTGIRQSLYNFTTTPTTTDDSTKGYAVGSLWSLDDGTVYECSDATASAAVWTAITGGTVTSVGLTMPSAFTVTNSPITSSGDIAVTGAGLTSQYIRGDGSLANFPTNGGGGSSVNYYLNGSINQGTISGVTYYEMNRTPILGLGTNFTLTNTNDYIASFLTDAGDPNLLNIPAGNWNCELYFNVSNNSGNPSFYIELYKYDGVTFTLIASSSTNPEFITNGTQVDLYTTAIPVPQTTLLATDRLAVRLHVNTSGNRTVTLHTEDNNLCQVITTFSTGLNALNGLTAQVQNFATGTSGTDFAISSVTDTHTFNLPTASAANRGALSSADWSTFNGKVNTGTITSSGLTMATARLLGRGTAGSGAVEEIVIGSGLTLTGTTLSAAGGGITIGTTAIASGTVGRVLFEGAGNVVQQDSTFVWNNTDKRLILGADQASVDTNPRLVVVGKNPSGTTTLAAFHNSTGNSNALVIRDDGKISFNSLPTTIGDYRFSSLTADASLYFESITNGIRIRNTANTNVNVNRILELRGSEVAILAGTGTRGLIVNEVGGGGFTTTTIEGSVSSGGTSNLLTIRNPGNLHGTSRILFQRNTQNYGAIDGRSFAVGTDNYIAISAQNAAQTSLNEVIRFVGNGNVLIGTTTDVSSRLHIVGGGTTSSTFGLQVHNSTGTNNALVVRDDGFVGIGTNAPRFFNPINSVGLRIMSGADNYFSIFSEGLILLGKNATANILSGPSNATGVAIGLNSAITRNAVAIGNAATACTNGISIGTSLAFNDSNMLNNVVIGNNMSAVGTPNNNVLIGNGCAVRGSSSLIAIGEQVGSHTGGGVNLGGIVTDAIFIGKWVRQGTIADNTVVNSINLGWGADNTNPARPAIVDAFSLYFKNTERSFFVNKNSNVVLRSLQALTSGTHFEAAATNIITIHNGTAPVANIADATAFYAADIAAGNAAPHFRTENGSIIKLYQETTGIAAAAFVANTSLILDDSATYGGYTMGQVVAALKAQGLLA